MSDDAYLDEAIAGIRKELETIDRLREELSSETAKPQPNTRAVGSILHDFSTCCERVFKRIAAEMNGGFYAGDAWHKELLFRMTIAVPDRRPAVLTAELAGNLDDYLSFRHVFRNIYGFELQGERLSRLASLLPAVSRRFQEEVQVFLARLEKPA